MAKTATKATTPVTPPKAASSRKTSETPTPATSPGALPASLINALPVSKDIMKHVQAIEALMPELDKQLKTALKGGAIPLARAFVVLHRMAERIASEEKAWKPFKAIFKDYKEVQCPHAFEVDGITNVPLAEGFRVGVSHNTRASMVPDRKGEAYEWLRQNYPDIIQEVVNASTLSKLAKEMGEENRELPDDCFNVVLMPTMSVTKT